VKETRILRNIPVWDKRTQHWVEIDLDVEIDIHWIAHQLAPKAYNNKKRKTRALHGLVEVAMRGTKVTPIREKVA
jgi:hypothetical protein